MLHHLLFAFVLDIHRLYVRKAYIMSALRAVSKHAAGRG